MNIDLLNTIKENSMNNTESRKGIEDYIKSSEQTRRENESTRVNSGSISGAAVAFGSVLPQTSNPVYGNPSEEENTIADQLQGAGEMTPELRKNQMAVLANTRTPEDLSEMEEEGFSASDTDVTTIVTVTDQIKANIAKTGGRVEGDLSEEELEQITGSQVLATQISNMLKENDLPETEQNVRDIRDALEMAASVEEFGQAQRLYMTKNSQAPTIENLYMAQHSAGMTQAIGDVDIEAFSSQVETVIQNAGLTVNDDSKAMAKTLLDYGIPLTAENLSYFDGLENLTEQTSDPAYVEDAITDALSEGMRPKDAMMLPGYSLMDRAQSGMEALSDITDEDLAYCLETGEEINLSNLTEAKNHRGEADLSKWQTELSFITAKRALEETRLSMTTEANFALLKKGISIDTKPLVELVDQLKDQEKNFYETLMQQYDIEPTEDKVSILSTTADLMEELKSAPATVLSITEADDLFSLSQRAETQKVDYSKAGEEYEKLWTSPRADMGDSIKKAFRNVDDILEDLNLDIGEENRRAVRILAYNKTELTVENINTVKEKDLEMQRTFANLTPRTTLEMIRKNINPLDMDLSELSNAAEQISEEIGDEGREKFSRYLYKLEQNSAISEEERSSYIGIYRLIAQVEKDDGAALGAAINQGTDITMRTLLTQIRNSAHKNKDYSIDDNFEGVESRSDSPRIDQQIEAAFQNNCVKEASDLLTPERVSGLTEEVLMDMTPEELREALMQAAESENLSGSENSGSQNSAASKSEDKAYYAEQLEQLSQAAVADDEIYRFLDRMEMQDTVGNIRAMQQMMAHPGAAVSTIWKAKDSLKEAKEILLERFSESLKAPEELADAMETLGDVAEHCMDGMIMEDPAVRQIDVKAMQLATKQITIATKRTDEESYVIPMETGDGVTGVSLKVVRGTKNKGFVDILFESSSMGKVSASFEAKSEGISGLIITDDEETRKLLADQMPYLAEQISGEEKEAVDLNIVLSKELSLEEISLKNLNRAGDAAATEAKDPVQTGRLYGIAKSFIGFLGEMQ